MNNLKICPEIKYCTRLNTVYKIKSTVFLLTLAVLENHEMFSSCFSKDDSEIRFSYFRFNIQDHLKYYSATIEDMIRLPLSVFTAVCFTILSRI